MEARNFGVQSKHTKELRIPESQHILLDTWDMLFVTE
jgi:hypothetical protein